MQVRLQAERERQGPLAFAGRLRKAGWGTSVEGKGHRCEISSSQTQRVRTHVCMCARVHTSSPRVETAGPEGGGQRPGAAHRADVGALPQLTAPSAGEVEESASTGPQSCTVHSRGPPPASLLLPQPVASFLTLTTPETETPPLLGSQVPGVGERAR